MKRYIVTVGGCDDSTTVGMEIADFEIGFLERVVMAINSRSNYCCQPTMSVVAYDKAEPFQRLDVDEEDED